LARHAQDKRALIRAEHEAKHVDPSARRSHLIADGLVALPG